MKIQSFNSAVNFNSEKVQTQVILETSFSKEIRIVLKEGQTMQEHKAPFPIIVHLLSGEINFGVEGESYILKAEDVITLDANVVHNLTANKNSIVRLTLSKLDKAERVEKVAAK